MAASQLDEQAIFEVARKIDSRDAREAYLQQICGNDPTIDQRVRTLLKAYDESASFLESPVAAALITTHEPVREGSGTVIGPYKLLEQIGEGGFGVVYMAEQTEPVRRKVALKVLKPGMDTRQVVARFEAERQALAIMDHPNIARVFDGGATPTGRPYFVMELVKGVPITEYCDQNHLTPRQRLELFLAICHAVQHAHQKGIIHRDLKPSNVLVSRHDAIPVVKIIDFGVAKALGQNLTDKTLFTSLGQMVGTPLYMSPEQAGMSDLDVDTRSDIYSLGVLLYELLTGTTPFTKERFKTAAYDEICRIIREEEPPKPSTRLSQSGDSLPSVAAQRKTEPSKLSKLTRGDLDWITMKALEKDRTRRYETANDFAMDVQRYLTGEPVLAALPSAGYRLRKFAKKNWRLLTTVAASVLLLLAAVTFSTWQALRATQAETAAVAALSEKEQALTAESKQRERAEENQRAAREAAEAEKQAKQFAQHERNMAIESQKATVAALEREQNILYAHRIALAHREWQANNVGRAVQLLAECPGHLRNWEWRYIQRLCHTEALAFRGHGGEVMDVAFSPDGHRVASAGLKEVKIWDAATGKEILNIGAEAGTVAFSPDGKYLAAGAFQTVKVWDATSGKDLLSIRAGDFMVHGVVFSPDGKRLASASGTPSGLGRREGGEVKIWDAATGKELLKFADLPHWANGLAFSPDGKYLAAGLGDLAVVRPLRPGQVRVWEADTGNEILTLTGHTFWVTGVAFSPDGTRLAAAGADRTVRVWEVPAGREILTLRGHSGWVRDVVFSPQGDRLASAGDDQVVRVWDAVTGQETLTLRGHIHPVRAIAFSPDGKRLASASGDSHRAGEVRVWDLSSDQSVLTLRNHTAPVTYVAFSPDGKLLASASSGMSSARPGEAKVRELGTGHERLTLKARMFGFTAVAFSPDGATVATAGDEGVQLWDLRTGNQFRLLRVSNHRMHEIAFSPDGKRVAAVGTSGVMFWDVETGQELSSFGGHTVNVHGVAFSPDGKRLATSRGGYLARNVDGVKKIQKLPNEVKIWNVATGKETFTLPGGGLGVAFSPNGKFIASGSTEGLVTVWDADSGKILHTLHGHSGAVSGVAFSRDSQRLATASADHIVKIWDAMVGQEVLTLRGHDEPVVGVAFSPDGRYLASASALHGQPGQVKVWDAGQALISAEEP